jgi:hypothetical protein
MQICDKLTVEPRCRADISALPQYRAIAAERKKYAAKTENYER